MEEIISIRFSRGALKNRIKFITDNPLLEHRIKEAFKVPNPDKRFHENASMFIEGISLTNSFQSGLFFDVLKVVRTFPKEVSILIDENIRQSISPFSFKDFELIQAENTSIIARPYQEEAIREGMRYGRGTLSLATSAGKSLIMYLLIKNAWKLNNKKLKVLVIVPGVQLVEQLYKDFVDYGCDQVDVTRYSGVGKKTFDKDANIIISNKEFLLHKENRAFFKKNALKDIEMIIVDEVHILSEKSSEITKFIAFAPTSCIFGLTGTLPDEQPELWSVIGSCGKILYVKPPKELQEENYIAQINLICIRFNHSAPPVQPPPEIENKLDRAKAKFPLEWKQIEESEQANQQIAKLALSLKGNFILLYDHNEHGEKLHQYLCKGSEENKRTIFKIDGTTPVKYREVIRQKMESESNCVLLANTACFKLGINIKNITNIMFVFAAGKKNSKIMQSIGRGLRLMVGKTHMNLIDVSHNYEYSSKHFSDRSKIYNNNYIFDKRINKIVQIND